MSPYQPPPPDPRIPPAPTIEWSDEEYKDYAFDRLMSVIRSINAGHHPSGNLNLFSEIPVEVFWPRTRVIASIHLQLIRQIQELKENPKMPEMADYNFEMNIEDKGDDRAILRFRYWPSHTTYRQRSFSPDDPVPPSPEDSE